MSTLLSREDAVSTPPELSKTAFVSARRYHGRDDLCRALLGAGASPAHTDHKGNSAASLARTKGNATLAALLEGVQIRARSRPGTPEEPAAAPPSATGGAASKRGDDVHPRALGAAAPRDDVSDGEIVDDEARISKQHALPDD